MRVLDKNRDYAEVYGIADYRYEQDGLRFDVHFNVIKEDANKVRRKEHQPPEPIEEIHESITIGTIDEDEEITRNSWIPEDD